MYKFRLRFQDTEMYSYISHRHIKTQDWNKIYMWNLYAFARLRVRNVSDSKRVKRLSVQ